MRGRLVLVEARRLNVTFADLDIHVQRDAHRTELVATRAQCDGVRYSDIVMTDLAGHGVCLCVGIGFWCWQSSRHA
jgi:hypothetical protein